MKKVDVSKTIGEVIASGRSFADIASAVGVSEAAVRKWATGRMIHPLIAAAIEKMKDKQPKAKAVDAPAAAQEVSNG